MKSKIENTEENSKYGLCRERDATVNYKNKGKQKTRTKLVQDLKRLSSESDPQGILQKIEI